MALPVILAVFGADGERHARLAVKKIVAADMLFAARE
jgi:hypothetical protein